MTPQQVAADFIRQHNGDTEAAFNSFQSESQIRLANGSKPNADFSAAMNLMSKLPPIQDEIDRLAVGKEISKADIFDNLIADRVSMMNEALGDELFESPDRIDFASPEQQVFALEQALITLQNKFPHVSKNKLEDVLWNIQTLTSTIEEMKMGGVR